MILSPEEEKRFWGKAMIGDGCWDWIASKNELGYGKLTIRQRQYRAHRIAYELLEGPIPDGMEIDHGCRNPSCIKPGVGHCQPVTHLENMRRGNAGHWQRATTHCPRGHPYDEANTYIIPNSGSRCCRACKRAEGIARRLPPPLAEPEIGNQCQSWNVEHTQGCDTP